MTTNKKLNVIESAMEKSDLSDSFAENPLVQWISHNGRTLLWLILTLIALSLLGYRLIGGSAGGSAKDYLVAENEMRLFLKSDKSEESLLKLTQLLKSHPELQAKYDGEIAQTLMSRGDAAAALPFAERTLKRLSKEPTPFYREYAATAMAIANKQYPEALAQAQELQTKIQKTDSALYAANLLRIATLQQRLGQKSEELKSWQQLKLLKRESFMQKIAEGDLTLLDYIAFREKELAN